MSDLHARVENVYPRGASCGSAVLVGAIKTVARVDPIEAPRRRWVLRRCDGSVDRGVECRVEFALIQLDGAVRLHRLNARIVEKLGDRGVLESGRNHGLRLEGSGDAVTIAVRDPIGGAHLHALEGHQDAGLTVLAVRFALRIHLSRGRVGLHALRGSQACRARVRAMRGVSACSALYSSRVRDGCDFLALCVRTRVVGWEHG